MSTGPTSAAKSSGGPGCVFPRDRGFCFGIQRLLRDRGAGTHITGQLVLEFLTFVADEQLGLFTLGVLLFVGPVHLVSCMSIGTDREATTDG